MSTARAPQPIGPHPAECGAESAGRPQRQLPDQPQLLSRSAQRRLLQHRRPGAAVQARHAGRAQEPARHRRRTPHQTGRSTPSTAGARRLRRALHRAQPFTGAPGAAKPVQVLGNLATIVPGAEQGARQPLRCAAGDRHLHQRGGHRPGHRHPRDGKDCRRAQERTAPRLALHSARPERNHVQLLHRPARPAWRSPSCSSTCSSSSTSSRGSIPF